MGGTFARSRAGNTRKCESALAPARGTAQRFAGDIENARQNRAGIERRNGPGTRFSSYKNAAVTEEDLDEYMKVGNRQHVRDAKLRLFERGDSPLIYSKEDLDNFVRQAARGEISNTIKGYERVGQRLADDLLRFTNEDVAGYFMEMDSNRLNHMTKHVEDDSDERNIPLTEDELVKLPELIDEYDEFLDYVPRKDGSKRFHIAKKVEDGYIVIMELISKGRQSIQPVAAWKNEESHYHFVWDQVKKAANTSRAVENTAVSGYKATSDNSIAQTSEKSNTPEENNSDAVDWEGNREQRLSVSDDDDGIDLSRYSGKDRVYMEAVKNGNAETTQRMVDEAAKRAGYDMELYHGSKKGGGFTVFKDWQYFTANKAYAERYMERDNPDSLYHVYVKSERMNENVIPLSERFRTDRSGEEARKNRDIRFSPSEDAGDSWGVDWIGKENGPEERDTTSSASRSEAPSPQGEGSGRETRRADVGIGPLEDEGRPVTAPTEDGGRPMTAPTEERGRQSAVPTGGTDDRVPSLQAGTPDPSSLPPP